MGIASIDSEKESKKVGGFKMGMNCDHPQPRIHLLWCVYEELFAHDAMFIDAPGTSNLLHSLYKHQNSDTGQQGRYEQWMKACGCYIVITWKHYAMGIYLVLWSDLKM